MNEPKGVEVVRWRCVNAPCRRSWSSRKRAREHAAECAYDPEVRACLTCRHYEPGEAGGWEDPGCPPECGLGLAVGCWGTGEPMTRGCPSWEAPPPPSRENPDPRPEGE